MAGEVVRRINSAVMADGASTDGDLFVIEESVGYVVNYLARSFARALSAKLAQHGVFIAQWAVLMFLWAEDGLTQKELSRRVAIEEATMVRTLDRMERDGLVQRVRNDRDRRRINIFLTAQGSALRDTLVPCAVAVNEAALDGLTNIEREQAKALMRRMIASLEGSRSNQGGTM